MRFSKVAVTPQGMVLFKMVIQVKTPRLLKTALDKAGAVQISIPPRSPDLNSIENDFNLVEKKLNSDAVKYSISKESYAKFVERVENTLLSYPIEPINNIIKSMSKRISHIIQSKGHRLKY